MKYVTLWCVAMVVGIVVALIWTDDALKKAEAEVRAETARREILQAELAEAKMTHATDTVRVTKWATRYDTVRAAAESILVAADSGDSSAVPFPIFADAIRAADSTVAACRQLVTSSGVALTACDSVVASVTRERNAYKNLYIAAKPSKWDKVKPYVFGAVGFYVGAKVRVQ